MKENVKVSTDTLNLVRDIVKETRQTVGGFYDLAAQEKLNNGIIGKIKDDKELYYAYQANIAMSVKDEFARWKKKKKSISYQDMHHIANNAARNFLDLLIK